MLLISQEAKWVSVRPLDRSSWVRRRTVRSFEIVVFSVQAAGWPSRWEVASVPCSRSRSPSSVLGASEQQVEVDDMTSITIVYLL